MQRIQKYFLILLTLGFSLFAGVGILQMPKAPSSLHVSAEADPGHSGWTHEDATRLTADYLNSVSYQLAEGHYYVADETGGPTKLILEQTLVISGDVSICLNGSLVGFEMENTGKRVILVSSGTLTLYSCKTGEEESRLFAYTLFPNGRYLWNQVYGTTPVPTPGVITAGVLSQNSSLEQPDQPSDWAGSGGGVYVAEGASLILQNGEISGNQAEAYGGGVFVANGGSFLMVGGKITGNVAGGNGGGVYVCSTGTFLLQGGTISGNCAIGGYEANATVERVPTGNGGGICNWGSMTMSGGSVTGNSATRDPESPSFRSGHGGGIYNQGNLTISAGSVFSNTAGGNGRGIYQNDGSAVIEGGYFPDLIEFGENQNLSVRGGYFPASAVHAEENSVYGLSIDTSSYRLMPGNEISGQDPDYSGFLELLEEETGYAVYKKGHTTFELQYDEIVYDGQPLEIGTDFTVRVLRNGVVDPSAILLCQYSGDSTDGSDGSFSDSPLVNAGTGWLRVSVRDSKIDYKQKAYYEPATESLSLTISKAELTDQTQDLTLPYDKLAHGPVIELSGFCADQTLESANGKIEYSPTGEDAWSEIPLTVTHVSDSKEIFYRISFQNYETVNGSCRVVITKATPTLPESPVASVICGQSLSEGTLTEGWNWANGDQKVTTENNQVTVYYALAQDHHDYDWESVLTNGALSYEEAEGRLRSTVFVRILHELSYVPALKETCTEEGHVEYWQCEICQNTFADESGQNLLNQVSIPATGHQLSFCPETDPTCTEDGNIEYWHCEVCAKNFRDEGAQDALEDISIPKLGHVFQYHEALAPTCTEEGSAEYWYCEVCQKYFSDENGAEELTTTTVPALGHQLTHHPAKDPTSSTEGNLEYWVCEHCGSYFADAEGIQMIQDKTSVILPTVDYTAEIVALIIGGVVILVLAVILGALIRQERRYVR